MGGFGSGILEMLSARGKVIPTKVLGVPDRFFEHASQDRLREFSGVDVNGIVDAARALTSGPSAPETFENIRTPSGVSS
jgi:1-deoxy-D-xylulose-5-phosphate synthase